MEIPFERTKSNSISPFLNFVEMGDNMRNQVDEEIISYLRITVHIL